MNGEEESRRIKLNNDDNDVDDYDDHDDDDDRQHKIKADDILL